MLARPAVRGYFDAPFGQIHYRSTDAGSEGGTDAGAGTGDSAVVLLHQSPLSSRQFEAVLPGFRAAGWRAVALDLPGFGASDPLPDPVSIEGYAAILPAALRHFGWQRCALVGHHTGAVIAAQYAADEPSRVTRLVLNGFPLLTAEERAHFGTFYFGPKTPTPDGSHLLTAWQNRLRSTPGWSDLELMHRYTVEGLMRGETNWKAFPLIIEANLSALLQRLRVPTLLLTNSGEDLYAATQRARDLRPGYFEYAELEGGTHDIIDEQSADWLRVVLRFLGEVPR
jgi:pimeloyl-ACP methyl ester carboxylesterase